MDELTQIQDPHVNKLHTEPLPVTADSSIFEEPLPRLLGCLYKVCMIFYYVSSKNVE